MKRARDVYDYIMSVLLLLIGIAAIVTFGLAMWAIMAML